MDLEAGLIPFTDSESDADINVEIYVVTGKHGFLNIPEGFCKECNMFYQAAKEASEEIDREVDIQVKSYWTRFLRPLLRGGYHAPVMLVNSRKVAQGYDVPGKEDLVSIFQDS